ncbi:hypothetical protein [Amycolatopsis kentuckyensis]|uniref:hypothetical protein n=1 Tax=Amycolatopsis kentuckyensis TaxID=218823 RepID=UPI0035693658
MPTHTVSRSQVGVYAITLVANTEEIVNFADDVGTIEIFNMDGAAPVYFTVNAAAATVAGQHTRMIPASIASIQYDPTTSNPTSVSLISPGTPTISVARA